MLGPGSMIWNFGELRSQLIVLLQPETNEAEDVVSALYKLFLGRAPEPEEFAFYIATLNNGTRAPVLARLLHRSEEGRVFAKNFPKAKALYRALRATTYPVFGKHYASALRYGIERNKIAAGNKRAKVAIYDTNCDAPPEALKLLAAINAERVRMP